MNSTTKPVRAWLVRRKSREPMRPNRSTIWIRAVHAILLVIALSVLCIRPAPAQSEDAKKPDLEQLQKRLEQLEQEMRDLKESVERRRAGAESTCRPDHHAASGRGQRPGGGPEACRSRSETGGGRTTLDFYGFAMLDTGYDFKINAPGLVRRRPSDEAAVIRRRACPGRECLRQRPADPLRCEIVHADEIRGLEDNLRI